ncbi:MAG: PadR family transcriptional regulator [Candidatus Thorarchaeota archaeon]
MSHGMRHRLMDTIETFRKKGATKPSKALSIEELGLPMAFRHFSKWPVAKHLPFVEVDGKYYLDEKKAAKIEDLDFLPLGPLTQWARQTARVPRGFLRYQTLMLLQEGPMSGSEIASRIEERTSGRYRPSPGSLYPLLAKLKEDGFTEELPIVGGVKRYQLTDLGHAFLDDQDGVIQEMRNRLGAGMYPILSPVLLPPLFKTLREPVLKLFETTMSLAAKLGEKEDPKIVAEIEKIVRTTTAKLEALLKRVETE